CVYDVSADQNFIIDYVPGDPRIVFATGLTGHGFKFGLLLGELLCNMVCEMEPVIPLEHFCLQRFTSQHGDHRSSATFNKSDGGQPVIPCSGCSLSL
ncbi:MAG TPA: hypothetical protein VH593_28735, partial [Ktedonobacteraceae bacterium]